MGKNKGNNQRKVSFKDDIKTKDNEVVQGLGFDVSEDVDKQLKDKYKETPSTRVLEELVENKIQQRVDLVKWALFTEYPNVVKEVENIKPDIAGTIDKKGNEGEDRYSKEGWKQKVNTLNKFDQLKKAITDAWKSGDYTALNEYTNKYSKQ